MVRDFFGSFVDEKFEFKTEFIDSLYRHPFMIYQLASSAITLYSNVIPGVAYRMINTIFGEELYDDLPLMFPLTNLIGLGLTNYYDVFGCLNLMQKRIDFVTNNPKARVKRRMDNAYKKEENKIVLWRGAVVPIEDLIQFDKWKGRKLFACFLMSTST